MSSAKRLMEHLQEQEGVAKEIAINAKVLRRCE